MRIADNIINMEVSTPKKILLGVLFAGFAAVPTKVSDETATTQNDFAY